MNIQQASELLGISTPLLSTLLVKEEIQSQQRGLERHVRYEDLLAYQLRRERERELALQEMVAENQRSGFYDDPLLPRKGEAP